MNTPDPSTTILSDEYDPTTDHTLALSVVRSVAIASNQESTDLPPLGETIDAEALESLIDSSITDFDASLEVVFEYDGYLVHIDDQGTITLHENSG